VRTTRPARRRPKKRRLNDPGGIAATVFISTAALIYALSEALHHFFPGNLTEK
jgi:hypothetical protein